MSFLQPLKRTYSPLRSFFKTNWLTNFDFEYSMNLDFEIPILYPNRLYNIQSVPDKELIALLSWKR